MGSLIFAYGLGAFFVLVPLVGRGRMVRLAAAADDQQVEALRRTAESRSLEYLLGVWAFLAAVGATFALIRGHAIGWAWLGVAALYGLGAVIGRQNRQRLLAVVGDRGLVERPDRYKQRAAMSYRFVAVGVTGYIGMRVVGYAYPHDLPTWAGVIYGAFAVALTVGAVGFLIVRARMYLAGDDLEPTGTSDPH